MRAWHVLKQAVRTVVSRREKERELDDEVQSYVEEHIRRNLAAGMSYPDARAAALRRTGSAQRVKDDCRDTWRPAPPTVESMFYDLRHAMRGLIRDRSFTVTAIATLGLAIGLNATVFTVMNAMLFRGMPSAERSDRLVYLGIRDPAERTSMPYREFEVWRSQAQSFQGMAFSDGGRSVTFRIGPARPVDMSIQRVTANTFDVLGVPPALGRAFVPADEAPGAPPVVILSHRFWTTHFGKSADVIGSIVHVSGVSATVIGVMPEGFVFVYEQPLWMPLTDTPDRRTLEGSALGRLRDDVTVEQARVELDTLTKRLQATDLEARRGTASVQTYSEAYVGPDATMIYGSLWAGAWFVVLIACANLANLTVVRTLGRWRDFSIRIALGAGQRRMIRLIVLDSVVLAGISGAVGWWLTKWSVGRWAEVTASRYLVLDYTVDARVLAYVVALSGGAAILFSVPPIFRISQLGAGAALKGDARGVTQGLRGKQVSAALVAVQMALAIVLLSGAGLLVRSLVNVVYADTGVRDPRNVLVASLRLPADKYLTPETRLVLLDQIDARLAAIPGVDAVSLASHLPVNWVPPLTFEIEGRPTEPDARDSAQFLAVGTGYFRTVGAAVTAGRGLDAGDRMSTLPVLVVNEAFVARFWPGERPLGKRIRVVSRTGAGPWRTVVGIVANVMQAASGDATRQRFTPLVYTSLQQQPMARALNTAGEGFFRGINLLVRTRMPTQLINSVRAEVERLDRDVAVEDVSTLDGHLAFDRDRMDLEHAELGKHAAMAPTFAVVALLLAAIGLYAVIAHSVSQRTKEIGVRMAIGASSEHIRGLIFREGLMPVFAGLTAGLFAAVGANRILQSQLVGVSPSDPTTLVVAPAALIATALLACHVPLRRALQVDPVVALQRD